MQCLRCFSSRMSSSHVEDLYKRTHTHTHTHTCTHAHTYTHTSTLTHAHTHKENKKERKDCWGCNICEHQQMTERKVCHWPNSATLCNTLQYFLTRCNALQLEHTAMFSAQHTMTHLVLWRKQTVNFVFESNNTVETIDKKHQVLSLLRSDYVVIKGCRQGTLQV